jgi:membrane protein
MARVATRLSRIGSGAWALARDTFRDWSADNAPRLGAALSYYTVFAISPLLVLVIAVAGFFLGAEAARGEIVNTLQGVVGKDIAEAIQGMLVRSSRSGGGPLATIISVVTLVVGGTGVMVELKAALNAVWRVKPKSDQPVMTQIRSRLVGLAVLLSMGFLLLVSLVVSAVLAWVANGLESVLPQWIVLGYVLNEGLSIAAVALLFALMFKLLPDAKITWHDVWIGAVVTSLLFHLGKFLIGFYLGTASVTSSFGAAGSLAALLVWVYYSSQIVLLGAEFTRTYAERFGSRVLPDDHALAAEPAE